MQYLVQQLLHEHASGIVVSNIWYICSLSVVVVLLQIM